jgi:TonB family protein
MIRILPERHLPASGFLRSLAALLIVSVVILTGCSRSERKGTAAVSTGTIVGRLHGAFVHGGNPFYGSVVYLIPVTQLSEDWWVRFARPRYPLVDPQTERWLGFTARTTCDPGGHFQVDSVPPGDYYLYARVFWTATLGDSTCFGGGAWIGMATAAARETARVVLRTPFSVFPGGAVPARRFPSLAHPSDSDLPRFGEYVYVEELPAATHRVPPEYPTDARRQGIDGTVMVQALVGKDGLVKDTRIVKSIPLLDSAATAAVRRWVFKPALADNVPVAVWVAVPVRFTLR